MASESYWSGGQIQQKPTALVFPFRKQHTSPTADHYLQECKTSLQLTSRHRRRQTKFHVTTYSKEGFDFDKLCVSKETQQIPSSVPIADVYRYAKQNRVPQIGVAWVNRNALDADGKLESLLCVDDNNGSYNYYSAHRNDGRAEQCLEELELADVLFHLGDLARLHPVMDRIVHYVAISRPIETCRYLWTDPTRCQTLKVAANIGFAPMQVRSLALTCRYLHREAFRYCLHNLAFSFNHPAQLAKFVCTIERRFEVLNDSGLSLGLIIVDSSASRLKVTNRLAVAEHFTILPNGNFRDLPSGIDETEWDRYVMKVSCFNDILKGEDENSWRDRCRDPRPNKVYESTDLSMLNTKQQLNEINKCYGLETDAAGETAKPRLSIEDWLPPLTLMLQRSRVAKLVVKCGKGIKIDYGTDGTYAPVEKLLGSTPSRSTFVFRNVGRWADD